MENEKRKYVILNDYDQDEREFTRCYIVNNFKEVLTNANIYQSIVDYLTHIISLDSAAHYPVNSFARAEWETKKYISINCVKNDAMQLLHIIQHPEEDIILVPINVNDFLGDLDLYIESRAQICTYNLGIGLTHCMDMDQVVCWKEEIANAAKLNILSSLITHIKMFHMSKECVNTLEKSRISGGTLINANFIHGDLDDDEIKMFFWNIPEGWIKNASYNIGNSDISQLSGSYMRNMILNGNIE